MDNCSSDLAQKRVRLLNLLSQAKIITGKDKYQRLYRSDNRELFEELTNQGFFDLFVTNRGVVVAVHQVVWFAEYGHCWLSKGLVIRDGERSIHHKNSDPTDNSLTNLVIVTNWEHQVIETSKNQYLDDRGRKFQFLGTNIDTTVEPRKNDGSLVKNVEHRLAELIHITRVESITTILNEVKQTQFKLSGGWITMPHEIVKWFFKIGIQKVREACRRICWQSFSWEPVISFT